MNLPNSLTVVRMFLVPLLVVVLLTEFEGRRILARHQLVYRTLGERMGREIHALSIEASSPV